MSGESGTAGGSLDVGFGPEAFCGEEEGCFTVGPFSGRSEKLSFIAASLQNPETSWSLGEYGALAEFHHSGQTHVSSSFAMQGDGAVAVNASTFRAIAYEIPSGRPGLWQHGVALCVPAAEALMGQREVVTDLGIDTGALSAGVRSERLFDLGLGLRTAAFCVRTADSHLLRRLTESVGRRFLEVDGLYDLLVDASPARVLISKVGRIEVLSRIPRNGEAAPEGPHTHLLPALLDSRQRHSVLLPIPPGWQPCMFLYPANALYDRWGRPRQFDRRAHSAFQQLLLRFGDGRYVFAKQIVLEAIASGSTPDEVDLTSWSRRERMAVRVAVRQLAAQGRGNAGIERWASWSEPRGGSRWRSRLA